MTQAIAVNPSSSNFGDIFPINGPIFTCFLETSKLLVDSELEQPSRHIIALRRACDQMREYWGRIRESISPIQQFAEPRATRIINLRHKLDIYIDGVREKLDNLLHLRGLDRVTRILAIRDFLQQALDVLRAFHDSA
jgi:hypothetical protein